MLKKLTMLAMSVAALVAFAVPATASAAEWTSNGAPLEGETAVKLIGHVETTVFLSIGTTAGTVHMEMRLKPGSTGTVTNFEVTNCVGTIAIAGIPCHATTQNTPWMIHCNGGASGSISITGIHSTYQFTGANPPGNWTVVGGVTATPDNRAAITSVVLSSAGATANGLPAKVLGTLNVESPHSGEIGCV
jgi:hypothetical protein